MRLGTGVVGVMTRGPALLAQQAAALADVSGGRFVLGIGASSDRIVEGWNAMPFERPLTPGLRDGRLPAHAALAGERTDDRLQARAGAGRAGRRSCSRRCAARCCGWRSRRPTGAFTNFLPLAGLPQVAEQLDGAPEGFELLCRFFCLPGEREQVEPLARFMFASYVTVPVYEAFFRWLGYGEQIDEMVDAWGAKDRERGDRGGALGADRGHVHLRHPG